MYCRHKQVLSKNKTWTTQSFWSILSWHSRDIILKMYYASVFVLWVPYVSRHWFNWKWPSMKAWIVPALHQGRYTISSLKEQAFSTWSSGVRTFWLRRSARAAFRARRSARAVPRRFARRTLFGLRGAILPLFVPRTVKKKTTRSEQHALAQCRYPWDSASNVISAIIHKIGNSTKLRKKVQFT